MPPTPDQVALLEGIRPAPRIRRLTGDWSYASWEDTAKLPEDAQNRLATHLGTIASETFGGDRTEHWRARCASGFFRRITGFYLIIDPWREVVGLISYHRQRFAGAHCLYLDSSAIVPSAQRGGLVGRLQTTLIVRECLRRFPAPVHLIVRTGNPVIYRSLRNGCGPANIWPSPAGSAPELASAIGVAAARWLGQDDRFDPHTFRLRDAYDALYTGIPRCGEADLDAFFRRSLRPNDAYLVVARLRPPTAVRAWLSRMWRTRRSTNQLATGGQSPVQTTG